MNIGRFLTPKELNHFELTIKTTNFAILKWIWEAPAPTGTIKRFQFRLVIVGVFISSCEKCKRFEENEETIDAFCLILSYCTMVNAHAGMYDRYLDMKICVDALVMVIAVIQVSIYLFLRYSKSKVSCWYKRLIIRIAKRYIRNHTSNGLRLGHYHH